MIKIKNVSKVYGKLNTEQCVVALTFALSGLVIFVASSIISDSLLIIGGEILFALPWWISICITVGIGLLLYGYFFIVLKRRLKRANLIKVLKEE